LQIAKEIFPAAKKIAIENYPENVAALRGKADQILPLNLERDPLPFAAESLDVIMANQLLEHTKEIFWIAHEVTRCLKVGGYFIMGVPNIASFHNRLLLLLGQHPTQHKLYSAHVRPFSKRDTVKFMDICFAGGYELLSFAGSQFYPLPAGLSRLACRLLPGMAFSIFFLFRKLKPYKTEFLDHPLNANLETPFYLGASEHQLGS
jgi:SAM-dependent methyltransferase